MTKIQPNLIAGEGYYSHEVPTTEGLVVTMRDGNHNGTSIWKTEEGFCFASHDHGRVDTVERVLLIRNPNTDELQWPYACDLGGGDGMAMIGVDSDAEVSLSEGEEIIWDSAK